MAKQSNNELAELYAKADRLGKVLHIRKLQGELEATESKAKMRAFLTGCAESANEVGNRIKYMMRMSAPYQDGSAGTSTTIVDKAPPESPLREDDKSKQSSGVLDKATLESMMKDMESEDDDDNESESD